MHVRFPVYACLFVALALVGCKKDDANEIEFRYAPITRGTLFRSISATGQVVALTTVDVKSKAGGKIVKLAVDEGTPVKQGQLIALIDPSDTQAVYDQANADLRSSTARALQARESYQLQIADAKTGIADAEAALAASRDRLERASIQAGRQPSLSKMSVRSAEAAYESANSAFERLQKVTIPQTLREAKGNLSQALASRNAAASDLQRSQDLLSRGFVATSAVEKARSNAAAADTAYDLARQRNATVNDEIRAETRAAEAEVSRTRAVLEQAQANVSEDAVTMTSLREAQKAVRTARIGLQKARDAAIQIQIKQSDVEAAQASTVRNRVSLNNAKVQLDSTTVLAPRDGVVTLKYLEEGTIIPPGTSTFAQGTSLVQISDVTKLYIECAVDEADIANVRVGQKVHVMADAFRGTNFEGVVTRVNPAAKTENNITAIKVRVNVTPKKGQPQLLPGMNATGEFITMERPNVLIAPSQAVEVGEKGKGTVRVKTADPLKPETREVTIGETGNDGIEIVSGLKEGEEVVTAEVNLTELRLTQEKMKEAEQGGGLAGGGPAGGRKQRATTTKTPAGGKPKG